MYVAHGMDGLRVLDVTNPAQPVELGHLEMPWRTFDIAVKDSLLYAAEGDSGLVVVDIRNPAQPQVIGRWNLLPNQMAYSLFVQDSLAYLCGSSLWIVNVADPRNPYYVGGMGGSGARIYDLWVRGRYAYVPDGLPWTFNVIDVGDPRDPRVVFTWDSLAPGGREVEGVDTLLFTLADFRSPGDGFYVLTIADPVRPHGLGAYARPVGEDDFYGLHYFNPHYVWVGGRTYYYQTVEFCGRMDLVDVNNPRPARSIRHYESSWTIADVWGENLQVAYGGAYLGNLLVFQVDSIISGVNRESDVPLRARGPELAVSPNPVRGSCIIRYWSRKEEKVRLTLYDLTGRVVRSFSPYASRLTPDDVYWDGRDGSGKEVRSGIYFLRAEGDRQAFMKKVVVVR